MPLRLRLLSFLRFFTFEAMKPAVVCIENSHLSEVVHAEASAMMDRHGYSTLAPNFFSQFENR
jgi:hypothetical protein